ncbi:MAG: hypothetical protein AAB421_02110 [Patescibacteria group bacterium]
MDLSSDKPASRWFLWSADIINTTRAGNGISSREFLATGTSLCQYIRVTCGWAPLVIGMHLAVYAGLLYVCLGLPFQLFGFGSTVAVYAGIALFVAAIYGLTKFAGVASDWLDDRARKTAQVFAPKEPDILSVLWQSLVAMKQKVCPVIKFKQ